MEKVYLRIPFPPSSKSPVDNILQEREENSAIHPASQWRSYSDLLTRYMGLMGQDVPTPTPVVIQEQEHAEPNDLARKLVRPGDSPANMRTIINATMANIPSTYKEKATSFIDLLAQLSPHLFTGKGEIIDGQTSFAVQGSTFYELIPFLVRRNKGPYPVGWSAFTERLLSDPTLSTFVVQKQATVQPSDEPPTPSLVPFVLETPILDLQRARERWESSFEGEKQKRRQEKQREQRYEVHRSRREI
jgi:hypothetical protein